MRGRVGKKVAWVDRRGEVRPYRVCPFSFFDHQLHFLDLARVAPSRPLLHVASPQANCALL